MDKLDKYCCSAEHTQIKGAADSYDAEFAGEIFLDPHNIYISNMAWVVLMHRKGLENQ